MGDLTASIERINPAHLAYAYIFTYMVWRMLDALKLNFVGYAEAELGQLLKN